MEIGQLGVWCPLESLPADETANVARRVEELGYSALWIPEAAGREALASAAFLLASTTKLLVATGIANIWARDAMTMACGRNTLAEQSGGRFLLGIGVSHRPLVAGIRGHVYEKPLTMMRNYLTAMENAPYASIPPTEPPPTVIGALHPKMLALAAEKTNGVHPYLVPPEHTAATRELLGPDPWICVEQKVLLEKDAGKARQVARQHLGMYMGLPNYVRNLERFGYSGEDFEGGGSDRLVDALVAWGDEKVLDARIRAHRDAGANHVCIQTLHPEGLPVPDWNVLEAFAPQKNR